MRPKDSPVSLATLLAKSPSLQTDTRVGWHTWRNIVGHRVASHSVPHRLEAGTLHVTVSSAIWASELSLLQSPILKRLSAVLPGAKMLRFRVGQVDTPDLPTPVKVVRAPLPDALASTLEAVEDPELRKVIAEAATYSLGRG